MVNLIQLTEPCSLVSWVDIKLNSQGQKNGRKIRGGRFFKQAQVRKMPSHLQCIFSLLESLKRPVGVGGSRAEGCSLSWLGSGRCFGRLNSCRAYSACTVLTPHCFQELLTVTSQGANYLQQVVMPPQWHSHPALGSHPSALITPHGPCLRREASGEKTVMGSLADKSLLLGIVWQVDLLN